MAKIVYKGRKDRFYDIELEPRELSNVPTGEDGQIAVVTDQDGKYLYVRVSGVLTPVIDVDTVQSGIDHGLISGLEDDDHEQYHNDSRATTWLGTQNIQALSNVSSSDTPAKNDIIIYNGTEFVFAPEGTTFTFSIASFTDTGGSSVVEIGSGTWKDVGEISFSASYDNGPATDGYVELSEWASDLTLSGVDFEGPTVNVEAVTYPSVGGSRIFTLRATDGTDNDSDNNSYYFYNRNYWGVSTKTNGYTEADVEGFANNALTNSRSRTINVTPTTGEYITYAYPSRLGNATFYVGGFEGGFEDPETVSITNASGYVEDYYVYRSTNSGLGATEVVVS
ncbi:hypothetical protein GF373_17485 [bacterium]|nr:hypothetical protein [bacterium]